jgi:hypothetical protein
MLLERGTVVDLGQPSTIAREYNRLNFDRHGIAREASEPEFDPSRAASVAQVLNAWFESADGAKTVAVAQREPCSVRMDVLFRADIEDPLFAFTLENESGQFVFATNTYVADVQTGRFVAGMTAKIRMRFETWLAPGRYRLFGSVSRAGTGADVLDTHLTSSIIVTADRPGGGLADLPHSFEIERGSPTAATGTTLDTRL